MQAKAFQSLQHTTSIVWWIPWKKYPRSFIDCSSKKVAFHISVDFHNFLDLRTDISEDIFWQTNTQMPTKTLRSSHAAWNNYFHFKWSMDSAIQCSNQSLVGTVQKSECIMSFSPQSGTSRPSASGHVISACSHFLNKNYHVQLKCAYQYSSKAWFLYPSNEELHMWNKLCHSHQQLSISLFLEQHFLFLLKLLHQLQTKNIPLLSKYNLNSCV